MPVEVIEELKYIRFNFVPKILEKCHVEAVRARDFIVITILQAGKNFLLGEFSFQYSNRSDSPILSKQI